MDGKTAAAHRGNLSNLVELLRSSARLIRNGALADRGATGLVLRRKGEQIVREAHALDPVKWSRTLSPEEQAAFINETGIDLGDQPLPIGPPETSDELHAHLWRAFIFGLRLRSPEAGSPPSAEELETCADVLTPSDGDDSDMKLMQPSGVVTLTTDHESVLTVLGKNPTRCMTIIDIAGVGPIRNRETVGRLLRELAGFGLVDRPHGKRKGYALTDAGRKRLPGASPT